MQTNIRVSILKGPISGDKDAFQFSQTFNIGRDATCQIHLPSPLVSRTHADVSFENGQWVLYDRNSTNGIWVNGARIARVVLDTTKEVEFGRNGPLLRFEVESLVRSVAETPITTPEAGLATSFWQSLGEISGTAPSFTESPVPQTPPETVASALESGFFAALSGEVTPDTSSAKVMGETSPLSEKPSVESGLFTSADPSNESLFASRPDGPAFEDLKNVPHFEEPPTNVSAKSGLESGFFRSLSEMAPEVPVTPSSAVGSDSSGVTGLESGFFRSLSQMEEESPSLSREAPEQPEPTSAAEPTTAPSLGTGFFAALAEEVPPEDTPPTSTDSIVPALPSGIFRSLSELPQSAPVPTEDTPATPDENVELGFSSGISSALQDLKGLSGSVAPDAPQAGLNTGFFKALAHVAGEAPTSAPPQPVSWDSPDKAGWDTDAPSPSAVPVVTPWSSAPPTDKPDWLPAQTDWGKENTPPHVAPVYEWSTPGMPASPPAPTDEPSSDNLFNQWGTAEAPPAGGLEWGAPPVKAGTDWEIPQHPQSAGMDWGSEPPARDKPTAGEWEAAQPSAIDPGFSWQPAPNSGHNDWHPTPSSETPLPPSSDAWSTPSASAPANNPPADWGSGSKWEPSAIAPSYQEASKTPPSAQGSVSGYMRKFESGQTAEMGSRTQMMMAAFTRMSKRDKRKYYYIIGIVAVALVIAAIWAFWKHNESSSLGEALDASNVALTTQDSLNVVLFYQIKELQLKFANDSTLNTNKKLRDETARKIIEMQQAYSEKMRARPQYRAVVNLANSGNASGNVDKLIYDITRLFGENEMVMPAGYVEKVKQYIKYWQSSSRYVNALRTAQENGYVEPIVASFMKRGVPPQFFYLGMQESNFNTKIVGPPTRYGHAKGMWQFIPATGTRYGLKIGPLKDVGVYDPEDERHDHVKAGEAAAGYIADIYKTDAQASGLCVMASYNWGEGNVIKRIRAMPNNPRDRNFWNMYTQTWMPEETKNYVFYITAAAVIGENPRLFGFNFDNPLAAAIQKVGSGQYVMPGGGSPAYSDLPPMTLAMDSEREQLFKFRTFW
ncbi:MAG: FHA domain-containing protein [Bacteroidetes Order II. Incertae sedis bacterium]|nr:FHA domain-containing protein [Bacteroidetes Order II. bacterium]